MSTKITSKDEQIYIASQWKLVWWRFRQHKLAVASSVFLLALYVVAVFSEFVAPHDMNARSEYLNLPPQAIHVVHDGRFQRRPFVYGIKATRDPVSFRKIYEVDTEQRYPVYFLVRGQPYRCFGKWTSDLHLFGAGDEGTLFLMGTDRLGRDLLSRIICGARVSLSIGMIGVASSFILGCLLGGISGYFGGTVDVVIQRIIEFLTSMPTIPLWMALSAALPPHWSPIKTYFGITLVLSVVGWCGLARAVRGKFLELREEDFVLAARLGGARKFRVIWRHMLPAFSSYLIVNLTLAIPRMILGETTLSYLGLGLRPPVVSWGVLLKEAQSVDAVYLYPWILFPAVFVVLVVLAFNSIGDGLRDAADPYGG